jgi:hypothetical protein
MDVVPSRHWEPLYFWELEHGLPGGAKHPDGSMTEQAQLNLEYKIHDIIRDDLRASLELGSPFSGPVMVGMPWQERYDLFQKRLNDHYKLSPLAPMPTPEGKLHTLVIQSHVKKPERLDTSQLLVRDDVTSYGYPSPQYIPVWTPDAEPDRMELESPVESYLGI